MRSSLRIAVCNLQTGIGTTRGYWQYLTTGWKYVLPHHSRPIKRFARFVREQHLDLVALCEVEGGSRRTRGVDQVALLADKSGLRNHVFFPTWIMGTRVNQGNAVCTRFPVSLMRNHPLPGGGEPRFLSEAAVDVGSTRIRLFVTHLSLERTMRRPQIHHLAEIVNRGTAPTILAGDFNVTEEAELALMAETRLERVTSAPTFPSWNPTRHLDFLFFSDEFTIIDSRTFDRFLFSDHLPFIAEVQLDPGN